jgi:hypothetical protein
VKNDRNEETERRNELIKKEIKRAKMKEGRET